MMLPELTEATIRHHASGDSFESGQAYYRDGAVVSLVRRGSTLEAQVEGSELERHRVRCTFDQAGMRHATCTCLYAYGGWCKHIVAALLAVSHGAAIEDRPPLDVLLADLDRDRLQSLVLRLAERDPDLLETIENEVRSGDVAPASGRSTNVRPPNLDAVRLQTIAALHHPPEDTGRGWYIFHLGPEASQLLQQVWALIRTGEGRVAMDILNAMTDECLENRQAIMEDEEGETLHFVQKELGPAWTEAILSTDLTPSERDGWEAKLDAWASELADYGDTENFEAALRALEEGWDDPALRRILRGEVSQREPEEGELHHDLVVRDRLTIARLNVLERQGRYDDYLNLARAEGQVVRYTTMLVRQGPAAAAAEYGLAHLERTQDALTLAQELREAGQIGEAVRVAERRLDLEGRSAEAAGRLATDLHNQLG